MITASFARQFAAAWIGAWNRHDLDAVLAHCADDIELTAPRLPAPSNRLRGKTAVAAWWAPALTAPALTVGPCLNLTAPASHPDRYRQHGHAVPQRRAPARADLPFLAERPGESHRHPPTGATRAGETP